RACGARRDLGANRHSNRRRPARPRLGLARRGPHRPARRRHLAHRDRPRRPDQEAARIRRAPPPDRRRPGSPRAGGRRRAAAPARRRHRRAVTDARPRQHYNVTLGVLALAATPTTVTWVLTVYLLSASVFTPILGRLGDMFGKERVLFLVLVMFAIGSLIAALSNSLGLLVAGRAVQGAAGAVFPLAFGIIRDEFPRERVATGIGLISATFGIGGGAGLVLSGLIVDHLSYRWIFWFGFVVVVVATIATYLF